jgi:hypothetical protein
VKLTAQPAPKYARIDRAGYEAYQEAYRACAAGTGSLEAMTELVTPGVAAQISAAEQAAARRRREARELAEQEIRLYRDRERRQLLTAVTGVAIVVLLAVIATAAVMIVVLLARSAQPQQILQARELQQYQQVLQARELQQIQELAGLACPKAQQDC